MLGCGFAPYNFSSLFAFFVFRLFGSAKWGPEPSLSAADMLTLLSRCSGGYGSSPIHRQFRQVECEITESCSAERVSHPRHSSVADATSPTSLFAAPSPNMVGRLRVRPTSPRLQRRCAAKVTREETTAHVNVELDRAKLEIDRYSSIT